MLTKYSVKRPFTIFVSVVIVMIFGLVSVYRMTPDLFPDINAPVSVVLTTYPGATSEEVESEVTNPIEEAVAVLPNVKKLTSYSTDNYSIVTLEFTNNVNMDTMTVDMRDKLDMVEGNLPELAAKPVVMKVDMNMMPVTIAAVGVKDKSPAEISTFVKEEISAQLESVEGVASVSKTGMIDEGIHVVLSQDKINQVNDEVRDAIAAQFNKGLGQIKKGINEANKQKKEITKGKKEIQKYTNQLNEKIKQKMNLATKIAKEMNKPVPDFIALKKMQEKIEALDAEIDGLQTAVVSTGTTYSDLAEAEGTVDSVVNQLKDSQEDLKSQKKSALDSTDMSDVITMDNVSALLQAQNFDMPAGYVSDDKADILVSVGDKIKDSKELKNLVLFDMGIDGVDPIKVKDIGTVSYLTDDSQSYAKINGENGILLSFTKQSTYATATVADNVSAKFKEIESKYEGVKFTALMDQGEYIHVVISSVAKDLMLGAIFAILILLFFLRDIRPTVITAVSIPVSVVFALALMYFTGVTLNMISLSGLAIGVGMLVDNSIVVIENIYRLRSMGYSAVQAALSGASQVAGAITASTLTTICVFVPIVFVQGMTKQIFVDLALTVAYSLLASLIIALTFVPAVAKSILVKKASKTVLGQKGRVILWYKITVTKALAHKKIVIFTALGLLIASSSVLLIRGFEFMPSMSSAQISATISMPDDSTLEETAEVNDSISKEIRNIDGVQDVGVMLSSDMMDMFGVSGGGSDADATETSMYIILDEDKIYQSKAVAKALNEAAKKHNCEILTSEDVDMSQLIGSSGITINLYADDIDKLRTSGIAVENRLREMKSLEEVSDIREDSTEEMHITVNKNEAMKHGLTVAQIYQQVAAKLEEKKDATTIKKNGTIIDISVENSTKHTFTAANLMDMKLKEGDSVNSSEENTKSVNLSALAEITKDASLNVINHDNQKRSLKVTASLKDGYNITKVTADVKRIIKNEKLVDSDVKVDFAGENEEIMNSMQDMLLMMLVGILLVYLIMVAQFQSLRSPFIIIFTLPLAFTGGMMALLVSNQTMSVIAMFGFVMLVGIVVNNGIVLVDCMNRFRLEGMGMDEAIVQAGAIRMRPVLMTAATTVLGLIPLALGFGQGAEMVQPVAITCVGGLMYATITTLFIIPIMYRWLSRKRIEKIKDEDLEIINV